MKGTAVLNSGALFAIAKRPRQRVKEEDGGIFGPTKSTLVALLFSAATLDGYISEVAFLARAIDKLAAHPSLSSLVDEIEDSRGSVRLKYLMARVPPTGGRSTRAPSPTSRHRFAPELTRRNTRRRRIAERVIHDPASSRSRGAAR
jgi:hypothetical protein